MTPTPAALPDLHDIVLPEPVSLLPQTPGWWVLLGLVLLVLAWATHRAARRRHANRYRRLALARLEGIEQSLADPAVAPEDLSALPRLVKQTALACRPRSEVAALSGEPWLRFLDRSYGGTGFTEGPGRLLLSLAYSRPEATDAARSEQLGSLVRLIRRWIRRHHAGSEADVRV